MLTDYFNELTKSLPEACLLLSASGRVVAVNQSAERMLGTGLSILFGQKLTDLVTDPDDKVWRYLRICLRNCEPVPGALRWRAQEGRSAECRCNGHLILPHSKEDQRHILLRCESMEPESNKFIALNNSLEQARISCHKLMLQTERLEEEVNERKLVEENLAERVMLAELAAEIGCALTMPGDLKGILNACAVALVRHLDVAFARIWTVDANGTTLELQASAGMYTNIEGSHSRIPVGEFKIGLIASERKPHITNSVIGDPRVHDQEWAKREGMVAFAGHPLTIDDRLVGVMALFSRTSLTEVTLTALAAVSNEIALGIERKIAEEELHLQAFELEEEVAERQMAQETLQEKAVQLEEEIEKRQKAQDELERLNDRLEQRVQERTAELATKNTELERMNRLFVGRELRMVELKEKIRDLKATK